MKRLIYVLLAAALLTAVAAVDTDEQCTADGTCSDEVVDESIPSKDEQLSITITNHSPYRVDVYFDDNDYGDFISTLEQNESTGINSFVGHSFFVTRHGVKVCYSVFLISLVGAPAHTISINRKDCLLIQVLKMRSVLHSMLDNVIKSLLYQRMQHRVLIDVRIGLVYANSKLKMEPVNVVLVG